MKILDLSLFENFKLYPKNYGVFSITDDNTVEFSQY